MDTPRHLPPTTQEATTTADIEPRLDKMPTDHHTLRATTVTDMTTAAEN